MHAIWLLNDSDWLKEPRSSTDDGGVAILVFASKDAARKRAAKHFGYEEYEDAVKDGWCEAKFFASVMSPGK